ncbi:unnamed protein product [Boreogadus saida]
MWSQSGPCSPLAHPGHPFYRGPCRLQPHHIRGLVSRVLDYQYEGTLFDLHVPKSTCSVLQHYDMVTPS